MTTRRVAVAMVAYTSGPLFQARFETRPSFQLTLIRTSEMETLLLHKQGNRAMGGYRACLTSGWGAGEQKCWGLPGAAVLRCHVCSHSVSFILAASEAGTSGVEETVATDQSTVSFHPQHLSLTHPGQLLSPSCFQVL